ncbi:MAG: 2-oxoacid:acceptor oxidoreductase family protein, partial [Zoogloeaceae bacterium]|nr:2-oxoacid:acceptor oxidoreductase family protein [Zoogloeaceae bacterium]
VVVAASAEALAKMATGRTRAVVNCAETPTSDFTRNPDWSFPLDAMQASLRDALGSGEVDFLDAQAIATALLGDNLATNAFLLGFAWQRGMIPASHQALDQAIELNGAAVGMNREAFLWGRRAAHDLGAVQRMLRPTPVIPLHADGLDHVIARRQEQLTAYQDAAYAKRYARLVERVRAAESAIAGPGGTLRLTEAVARQYARVLAYKDEYEVARLYTDPAFWDRVDATFEGDFTVRYHLAAPLLARPDPKTGRIAKRSFGPGMMRVFRVLARFKGLRGTRWDPFGYSEERRMERELIVQYEQDVEELLASLSFLRRPLAVEIASLPEGIRGFGHVKARNAAEVATKRTTLLDRWRTPEAGAVQAA